MTAAIEDPLSAELAKMGAPAGEVAKDSAPATKRKRSSGTSGAERARRARAATPAAPGGATPASPSKPAARRPARRNIGEGMTELYANVGAAVAVFPFAPAAVAGAHVGQPITKPIGAAMIEASPKIGAAWDQAAKDDARIRDALDKLLTATTIGNLIAAHMPIMFAAGIASGRIPEEIVVLLTIAALPEDERAAAMEAMMTGQNTGGRP